MSCTEVCPSSYFRYSGYFWGPWVSFATTHKLSVRVTKLLQGLVSHELTVYFCFFKLLLWIMAILSKRCIPDNFEPHNSLKHSFTNIRRLRSSFVEFESFLESSRPDILALCEANLDDSGNFSVKGYLPLIRKILLLICMVLHFMWKKDSLLHGTYLKKTLITYVSDWLYFTHRLT